MGKLRAINGQQVGRSVPRGAKIPTRVPRPTAAPAPKLVSLDACYPYQRIGATWLASRTRALLGDPMGIGKTCQALHALPERVSAIVVCPAALRGVWARECDHWRPDLQPIVNKPGEPLHLPTRGQLSIMAYSSLPPVPPGSNGRYLFPFDCTDVYLIADEAHYAKNPKAARTIATKALANQVGHVWPLSGSPLLGMPADLWGTLDTFGLAELAFGDLRTFHALFHGVKRTITTPRGLHSFWEYPNRDPEPEAFELLRRVMLRRSRKEVLPDLPEKTTQWVDIDAPAEVRLLLDGIESSWTPDPENPDDLPPLPLVSAVRAAFAESRIPALLEHVETYEETWRADVPFEERVPLVVFSAHRAPVQALGGRPGWGVITGDMSTGLRDSLVAAFQGGLLHGLALTIGAGGVGITLTRAYHALFVDLAYTPAENEQAEDRLYRIGQKNAVLIRRMVSDHPLDRWMNRILAPKQRRIDCVVGA